MLPTARISTIRRDLDTGASVAIDLTRTDAPFDRLTPRELEVAILVAKGYSNKEVGQILDISHWTVAAHLKATFLKLELMRRSELAYILRYII